VLGDHWEWRSWSVDRVDEELGRWTMSEEGHQGKGGEVVKKHLFCPKM
jgi:hypothetical protein